MSNGKVVTEEVDTSNLGEQEKKRLMDSILRAVEDDNEKFLQKLRARNERFVICILFLLNWGFDIRIFCLFGRQKSSSVLNFFWLIGNRVGIDVPKVEVRFEKVSIEGDAYVGSRALPTLLNSSLNMIEVLYNILKFHCLFLNLYDELRELQISMDMNRE